MKKDVLEFLNELCLSCNAIERNLVRIGPMIFCRPCWEKYFGGKQQYNTNSPEYKRWISLYKVVR